MGRSKGFSVYIEPHRTRRGFKTYRVRREFRGRELPAIPCGADQALAKELRDSWRTKLRRRKLRLRSVEEIGLAEWAESDLKNRSGKMAATTQRHTRRVYDLLLEFMGPDAALGDVDRDAIRDFIAWLESYKIRGGGVFHANASRIYLRSLKAGLRRAMKDGRLEEDPFFGAEMPAEISVANPPSDAEIKAFWKHLPYTGQRAITVYLGTGLRRSELLGIAKKSILKPTRRGGPRLLRVQKAKTRRGAVEWKIMAIQPAVWAALQPIPDEGPIFKLYPSTLSSWLRKARKAAGLERIRLHDLRHRWATDFMSKIRDKWALKQVGGWTSDGAVGRYQHETAERAETTLDVKNAAPPLSLPRTKRGRRQIKADSQTVTSR